MEKPQDEIQQDQPIVVAELLNKLDKLVGILSIKNAPSLWDAEQMAEWFGVTPKVAKYTIAARTGFPQSVIPTNTREGKKLWFADEVIEWARLNRGVLPNGRKPCGRPRKVV